MIVIIGKRGLVSKRLQSMLKQNEIEFDVISTQDMLEHGYPNFNESSIAVLCTEGFVSPQIVSLIHPFVKILDVSPEFRTNPEWLYGMLELPGTRQLMQNHTRVANPGCFATSAILLLQPLITANLLPADQNLYLDGVGGYSTGGSKMIEMMQTDEEPFDECVFSLTREHRHVSEIKRFSGTRAHISFTPKIAKTKYGIRMMIQLYDVNHQDAFNRYEDAYQGTDVQVLTDNPSKIEVSEMAYQDGAKIRVYENNSGCLVVCTLDNMGKGAINTAYNNLMVMRGC